MLRVDSERIGLGRRRQRPATPGKRPRLIRRDPAQLSMFSAACHQRCSPGPPLQRIQCAGDPIPVGISALLARGVLLRHGAKPSHRRLAIQGGRVLSEMFRQQGAAQRSHRLSVGEGDVELTVAIDRVVVQVARAGGCPRIVDDHQFGMDVDRMAGATGIGSGQSGEGELRRPCQRAAVVVERVAVVLPSGLDAVCDRRLHQSF